MRIGLNALQVRAAKSGVGQYIDGLIDGLLACLDDADRLIVYATPQNAMNYRRDDGRMELRVFGPRAKRPARLLHEWLFLPRQIRRDSLDVFHGPANFLPRHCPCPAVVTIHDASRWVDPRRFTAAKNAYWHWMTAHTLRQAAPVITVSHAAAADLRRHLRVAPERLRVIHEAAHPRFRPLDAQEVRPVLERLGLRTPYVFHAGTIEPGKNLVMLLEAFAAFRAAPGHGHWRLVLSGDRGWKTEAIFAAIDSLGLAQAVDYAGHVSDADLVALYNGAAMFCFPSLNEGFGLPPLEAMQCGTPVAASNRSSMPEVLGEAPLYADPLSAEAFARAMCRLAGDPIVRQEAIQAGFEQARRYSWEKTARQTLAVYHQVAQAGK